VLDPSKISREKRRISSASLSQRNEDLTNIRCIGLDSKRDAGSLVIETRTEGGKTTAFKTKATVDHLTFTTESGIYKKESLALRFEPFRFWIRICGDNRNRKTKNDSRTCRVGEAFFYFEYFREFESKNRTARNVP
jgi:hypothetical protein